MDDFKIENSNLPIVEKSIEISIGFLHRKLAYGAP
jgi:hypothetical protein